MKNKNKKVIEINGIKMEIDLRKAKVIDEYKIGDNLKVLVKTSYGDKFESYIGTIIGFDEFETHPTIVIAYLKTSYSHGTIEYIYFNDTAKDVEVCPLNDWDIPITKTEIIDQFDSEIKKAQEQIKEVQNKKKLFSKLFGKYFETIEAGIKHDRQPF